MSVVRHPIVWGWRMPDGSLCYWAEPDLPRLLDKNVPGPDCEPIRCRLVPVRDYGAMRRGAK